MRPFWMRFLLNATTSTEGTGTDAGTGTTEKPAAGTSATQPDASEGYKAALKKHGDDASAMARQVYADNETLRRENEALKGKVPGDGAVVLNKADAGRWSELGKLGGLDEVKTKLTAGDEALGKVAKFEREKRITSAAALVGFDADVLADLAGDKVTIEVRDETKAGKTAKVAVVVTKPKDDKGEGEETQGLKEYAEATWPKFLASLKPDVSQRPKVGGTPSGRIAPTRPAPTGATGGTGEVKPPTRRLSL